MWAPVQFCVQVVEHVFDHLIVLLFIILRDGRNRLLLLIASVRVLQLAVPDLLDLVDLVVAEVEPFLELRTFLEAFGCLLLVCAAILVVEGALSEVAQFKCDLADLAEVETRGDLS